MQRIEKAIKNNDFEDITVEDLWDYYYSLETAEVEEKELDLKNRLKITFEFYLEYVEAVEDITELHKDFLEDIKRIVKTKTTTTALNEYFRVYLYELWNTAELLEDLVNNDIYEIKELCGIFEHQNKIILDYL